MASRKYYGVIINWDDQKGYGFIESNNQPKKVFFHISAFHYVSKRPKTGQKVTFYYDDIIKNERPKALRVVLSGDERYLFDDITPDQNGDLNISILLLNSVIGISYLIIVSLFSKKVAIFYLIISMIAFFIYRTDKNIAQKANKHTDGYIGRIPETNLHQLSIIGGWPGAWIARTIFNHKTSKTSFIRTFWLCVAINIGISYSLLVHYGSNPLLSFLKN